MSRSDNGIQGRPKLYQEGENPGGHGTESGLPDGPGGKLKRVMMARKLRAQLDVAPEMALEFIACISLLAKFADKAVKYISV